jgi:hypothetical protein
MAVLSPPFCVFSGYLITKGVPAILLSNTRFRGEWRSDLIPLHSCGRRSRAIHGHLCGVNAWPPSVSAGLNCGPEWSLGRASQPTRLPREANAILHKQWGLVKIALVSRERWLLPGPHPLSALLNLPSTNPTAIAMVATATVSHKVRFSGEKISVAMSLTTATANSVSEGGVNLTS